VNGNPERSLAEAVADVAPPGFTAGDLIARVRRRRRAVLIGGGAAATALVLMGVMAVVQFAGGLDGPGRDRPAGSAVVPADDTIYVCGQKLDLAKVESNRDGVSISINAIESVTVEESPRISIAISADRNVRLISAQPTAIEVLYIGDGVIVGGGPRLNMPGKNDVQWSDLVGYPIELFAAQPKILQLGARPTLCPEMSWVQMWAAPDRYEVVVILNSPTEVERANARQVTRPLVVRAPLRR